VLEQGVNKSFDEGFMANMVRPASTGKGGHFKVVGDNSIKYKVQ